MLFIETSAFSRQLDDHLGDDAYADLQRYLSRDPAAGDVIQGTGGLRKVRWSMPDRGKRSGIRIVYYWMPDLNRIYLLTVYSKGAKDDLSPDDRRALRKAVETIENEETRHRGGATRRTR